LRMCVSKHSTWMNPRVSLRIENASIRCDFLFYKKNSIPQAAHLQFWVMQARVAIALKENPGVFSSRVLELDTVVYYFRTLCLLEYLLTSDHRHATRLVPD
jgi:16S rRNA G1207 methylase RsmC